METSLATELEMKEMTRTFEGELNLIELEHTCGQNNSPIPQDWCILDNQSTVNILRNREYLENIWQIKNYVVIKCNAGTQTTNWMGDFPGYPELVWYDPGGIANIISLKVCEEVLYNYLWQWQWQGFCCEALNEWINIMLSWIKKRFVLYRFETKSGSHTGNYS